MDEKWVAKDNWSDQKASFVAADGQGDIQCAKLFPKDTITASAMPALTAAQLEKVEETSAKEMEKEAGFAATPNRRNSGASMAMASPAFSESGAPAPAQGAEGNLPPPMQKRKRRCVRPGVA